MLSLINPNVHQMLLLLLNYYSLPSLLTCPQNSAKWLICECLQPCEYFYFMNSTRLFCCIVWFYHFKFSVEWKKFSYV